MSEDRPTPPKGSRFTVRVDSTAAEGAAAPDTFVEQVTSILRALTDEEREHLVYQVVIRGVTVKRKRR